MGASRQPTRSSFRPGNVARSGGLGFCDNRTVSGSTTPSRIALVTGTMGQGGTYLADAIGMNVRLLDATRRGYEARRAEEPQAKPEQNVIIAHGGASPAHRLEHDKHGGTAWSVTRRTCTQAMGEVGDCSG
jgi:hypothetical protein